MNAEPETVHLPLRELELPADDEVELWLANPGQWPIGSADAGLTRRERIVKQRVQQQFILRLLLGAYLDVPGKSIRLVRSPAGKPGLAPEWAGQGLNFSLSHSGDWLLIGVARHLQIGVDIEHERRMARARELADRFFPDAERQHLAPLDEPDLSLEFLRLWTAKEAMIKAAGAGIAGHIGRVTVIAGEHGLEPADLPADWPVPAAWTLLAPSFQGGLIAHAAVPARIETARLRHLAPPPHKHRGGIG